MAQTITHSTAGAVTIDATAGTEVFVTVNANVTAVNFSNTTLGDTIYVSFAVGGATAATIDFTGYEGVNGWNNVGVLTINPGDTLLGVYYQDATGIHMTTPTSGTVGETNLPTGGATGDVLTKQSASDQDATWAPPAAELYYVTLHDYGDPNVYTGNAAVDEAALNWAIANVPLHGFIALDPGKTLTLANRINVNRSCTIGGIGGKAVMSCPAGTGFDATADDVTIKDIRATGPTNIGLDNNSNFVWGKANGLTVNRITTTGFSIVAFASPDTATLLTDYTILNIRSDQAGYAGIGLSSVDNFTVDNCTVTGVTGDNGTGQLLAYGATATSSSGNPYSRNGKFTNNIMRDIPWEGLDTHGGRNITMSGNIIEGCYQGIVITKTGDNKASHNITINNNVVDSLALGDQDVPGIIVSGVDATTPAEVATVTGNTVAGFRFGIQVRNADSVSVTGNVIKEPRSAGVRFRDYAAGGVAVGNVVIDPYGQFFSDAGSAVHLDTSDPIVVVGNTLRRPGGTTAAAAANYGEHIVGGTGAGAAAIVHANNAIEANTGPVRSSVTALAGAVHNLAGPTAERPTNPVLGQEYFDTDLNGGNGMSIRWNSTNWVNASTGTTV